MKLKDKICIVTGAAGGLGTAITKEFLSHGARVIVTDTNAEALHHLKESLPDVIPFELDVLKKADIQNVFQEVKERFGGIDCLVNNAGGSLHTPKKLEEIEEDHWELVINVNLRGTFFCSQAVVPYMKEKGSGSIVNITSIGARSASPVTGVAYAAAKGGIISFSRRLALEVGNDGIRVNSVAPGLVLSGQRMQETWEAMLPEERDSVERSIPLNRLGTSEEQARAVAFLASEESSYMTGTVVDVNGGRFMA